MVRQWEVVHFSFPFLVHFCIPVDSGPPWPYQSEKLIKCCIIYKPYLPLPAGEAFVI
jgi:hypothetical protein